MAKDIAGFEEVKVVDQIATKVFEEKVEHLTTRLTNQERLSNNIIFGAVIVVVVTVFSLIWGAWAFIGEYNQHYLDAETNFQKEIGELRQENFEFQKGLMKKNEQNPIYIYP